MAWLPFRIAFSAAGVPKFTDCFGISFETLQCSRRLARLSPAAGLRIHRATPWYRLAFCSIVGLATFFDAAVLAFCCAAVVAPVDELTLCVVVDWTSLRLFRRPFHVWSQARPRAAAAGSGGAAATVRRTTGDQSVASNLLIEIFPFKLGEKARRGRLAFP